MSSRRRTWWWIALALLVIVAVSSVAAYLTTPRPGGEMDPRATSPQGAHALVTLLRNRGVDVTVADTVDDVVRKATPDTLVLVAQTPRIRDDALLNRLADLPGDLLLVAPDASARTILAPDIRTGRVPAFTDRPGCALREAERAGTVDLGAARSYVAAPGRSVDSCYGGALVRYRDGGRTVTVVGSASFLTNAELAREGNAALAMNLAGSSPRLIWFAPQHILGDQAGSSSIFDLIPANVRWLFWQLCTALALAAWWRGRRLGPLVSEPLPVVVRASETVEGLGRLYRSRRARGRAAAALRTAALRRLGPRLGLGPTPEPPALVDAAAQRLNEDPDWLRHVFFGPTPDSDDALIALAHGLDDIERQVTDS